MDESSIQEAVIAGQQELLCELVNKELNDGSSPNAILNAMIAGMGVVGERFQRKEYFIPDVMFAARAMTAGTSILKPLLVASGAKPLGKVVIGTVLNDQHDIGKNIVAMMLEGAGFEVVNLGRDVAPERFVESVRETNAKIVGLSSLITTSMPQMKRTIDLLSEAGLRDSVFVLIGGAPVTEDYAKSIGADGYADDATGAVQKVKELLRIEC
ncbi:MAG: corrinoid protein [Candidatus Coatesbacteria bacterium]|nr:corrinoid protein [Candidatus Coatesbacteria bacterium]